MNIKDTVKNIFLGIAKKIGLKLVQKSESQIDFAESGLNPTAIGSNVVANIAIDDSDIVIEGENSRAKELRKLKDYYTDEFQNIVAEVSLGTGDAIVRPYTDGEHIGLNVIGNDKFIITECIGTHIKGVIMLLDEYTQNNKTYRLFESQTVKHSEQKQNFVYIRRLAYVDDKETPLSSTSWKDIQEEDFVIADQILVGRYKCPTINRENYNSVNGVPITFGCEDIITTIQNKYKQYNEEFDQKQSLIFADKTMFNSENNKEKDAGTKKQISGKTFFKIKGGLNNGVKDMIEDYSPAIRETEFREANNFNLSVLELCCGFSRGVFTTPETAFATATEMINSLKKTFAFVKRFRKRLELGDKMLFNALNIIVNINNTTPLGDWEIRHDWSYDYIEETKERFNQLLQGHSAGVVKDETLCAWINNLDEEEAAQYMAELKATAGPEVVEDGIIDDGITNE